MSNKVRKAQVVLAVIDEDRQGFHFLLLKTNQRRGHFWQNVTGKIEEGETIEEGGLREAIEETNLAVEDILDMINLGLEFRFIDQHGRKVTEECFLIILDKKWEVKTDPHEHEAFKWIKINELTDESVKYSSNLEALEKAKKRLLHWGGR